MSRAPGQPRRVEQRIVQLDYGQFGLCGNPSPDSDYLGELERAIAGPGIAGDDYGLVVVSPHQNNFEMPFRLEEWDTRPPDDEADWEEVFEGELLVVDEVLTYFSPTDANETFPVPNGRYAVRISGRGFVNRGWPGSTTPGDSWRVQLWPAAGEVPARRVKRWRHPGEAP
ncbi:hypothetical protein [Actinoplanes sp. M2I2]|uniref:hypothetical protein n=1 Tax=Actinoplanes sp. M2I2 TaxID=1734444 RepID=UPI0020206BC1|nr:hypothetical protein [Actinoplanes sp. M2I2]